MIGTEQIDIPTDIKSGIIKLMNTLNRNDEYKDKRVMDFNLEVQHTGDDVYSSKSTYLTIVVTDHIPSRDYSPERYWSALYLKACDYLGHKEYKHFDDGEIVAA